MTSKRKIFQRFQEQTLCILMTHKSSRVQRCTHNDVQNFIKSYYIQDFCLHSLKFHSRVPLFLKFFICRQRSSNLLVTFLVVSSNRTSQLELFRFIVRNKAWHLTKVFSIKRLAEQKVGCFLPLFIPRHLPTRLVSPRAHRLSEWRTTEEEAARFRRIQSYRFHRVSTGGRARDFVGAFYGSQRRYLPA